MFPRTEMLDLVVVDGRARGIIVRDLVTGKIESHSADAVVLATGGYGNVFYLSTNARGRTRRRSGAHTSAAPASPIRASRRSIRRASRRAGEHQSKLTLMSRVAAQRRSRLGAEARRATRARPSEIPDAERDYYLERKLSELRQPVAARHRLARREAGMRRRARRRSGRPRRLPRLPRRDRALGEDAIRERYGNLFEMYERITGENPYAVPMRIYPGGSLHDGWALGRLRPDEHDPRAVRARRGELLRSRREPARRERADAGARRRLLHRCRTRSATTLRAREPSRSTRRRAAFTRGRGGRARAARSSSRSAGGKRSMLFIDGSARSCGSTAE